ncbi:hypothetical protein [Pseudomonas viridiflava]|uniref:hypothetical protein n=1 Tax=Pseudomonas viridiflava TaxID=33069 RepID=UPI0013CF21A8|nr:hypothetical protein [Pseudomonas viridiflava]
MPTEDESSVSIVAQACTAPLESSNIEQADAGLPLSLDHTRTLRVARHLKRRK